MKRLAGATAIKLSQNAAVAVSLSAAFAGEREKGTSGPWVWSRWEGREGFTLGKGRKADRVGMREPTPEGICRRQRPLVGRAGGRTRVIGGA